MAEQVQNQLSWELVAEFIDGQGNPERKKFTISPEQGSQVKAGALKMSLLNYFGEASPILEPEEMTDENRSYHLLGLNQKGQPTTFPDDGLIDLDQYTNFQISPRTMGGGLRLG